jgi:hypothetical protein
MTTKDKLIEAIKSKVPRLMKWEIAGLAEAIAEIQGERTRDLEAMLKKHEWCVEHFWCPECGMPDKHNENCQLAKLLEGVE